MADFTMGGEPGAGRNFAGGRFAGGGFGGGAADGTSTSSTNPNAMQWYNQTSSGYNAQMYQGKPPMQPMAGTSAGEEEPLIQELGIDIGGMSKRILLVLTLQAFRDTDVMAEADVAGALAVILGTGAVHLLLGKFHFGVLLGWAVVASVMLSWMFSLLGQPTDAGPVSAPIGPFRTWCILGYSQLPMVGLGALRILLPKGVLLSLLAVVCVGWSSATVLMTFMGAMSELRPVKYLAVFPVSLFYIMIAILTLY